MPLLRFTGHPIPDVGIAAVCGLVGKSSSDELSLEDLDMVAKELAEYYFSGLMTSYLSCVFMNSEYVQPKQSKRQEYAARILYAHRWPGDDAARGLRCVYSGEPATHLVHRSQIPMLTGQDVINFYPAGRGGLPVSGKYLAVIQALPMGGRRAEGRLLFAHSDDAELMISLATRYIRDNRRLLNLAKARKLPAKDGPDPVLEREHAAKDQKTKGAKYPDAKGPTSLIASDLVDISGSELRVRPDRPPASVTVYVMSNSGQGPSLEIHHVPSQLVKFLRLVGRAPTGNAWRAMIARSWRSPQAVISEADTEQEGGGPPPAKRSRKEMKEAATPVSGPGRSRNDLFADLFPIFDSGFTDLRASRHFLRKHVLGDVSWSGFSSKSGPQAKIPDASAVDWEITRLFLCEVMGMDEKRVGRIREFADGLAKHVLATNDKRLFQDVVFSQRSWEVRNALTKAQRDEARERNVLLFGMQDYLEVFEAEDSAGAVEWGLVRDLISIRLVETLQKQQFFSGEKKDWLSSPES
jgi:CRISPR-associated protein Cst1